MILEQSKNIFFLGIKGVAMANLAVILKKMGKNVTGCDLEEEFITDKLLNDNKITWQVGFNPDSLPKQTDLIVYSAAHGGTNNPIVAEAIKNNINIISQAKLLGDLMDQFKNKIAVCGCHGKTTTSSLLVYALNKLKVNPSYLVGVPFFSGFQGGDFQGKKYFIVEADEYGVNPPVDKTPKFYLINPNYIIATNIDFDHPDVYKDIDETKTAFTNFLLQSFNRLKCGKFVLCADDENLMDVAKNLPKESFVTYGQSGNANYQILNIKINEIEATFKIKNVGEFKISLFGKHNILNATAVIVQLLELGFKAEEIQEALIGFTGAERRFEQIYFNNNIYLFDDYAHHPAEISATINGAKSRFPKRRLIIIFQPHTYSRTKNLLNEFGESLSLADICLILPIFASARENSRNFKVTSQDIVVKIKDAISKDGPYKDGPYFGSKDQLIKQLGRVLQNGDVVFTMGAGDVYKLKDTIIKIINNKSSSFAKASKDKQMTNKFKISNFKFQIEKNKNLKPFNTLKTNSFAEYFLEAKTRDDLIEGKKFALENNLPIFIIAGGSNLAIVKEKINGLVIKNSYKELKLIKETNTDVYLSVSSGYPVALLVNETVNKGYEGIEYHKGLPGTVGGAIYMNSKWTKPVSYFGDNLKYAYLVNDRTGDKKVNREYFQFAYDYSILQKTHEILLEAVFKFKKINPEILKERAQSALNYRIKTQPMGEKTSGCFFRNVNGKSAGQMIDKSGLKGFKIGDFLVSPIHANFIINRGNGKNEDLIQLVKIIKDKVKKKFGVELIEEVIIV